MEREMQDRILVAIEKAAKRNRPIVASALATDLAGEFPAVRFSLGQLTERIIRVAAERGVGVEL